MIFDNTFIKILKEYRDSTNHEDRVNYLRTLKFLGQQGKKLYKLYPDKELKENIFFIKQLIDEYDLYPKVEKII